MPNNTYLLRKKSYIYEIKSWKSFLPEMIVVITLIILLHPPHKAMLNFKLTEKSLVNTKFHEITSDLESLQNFRLLTNSSGDEKYNLFFTPDNELTQNIANEISKKFQLKHARGFSDKQEMLKKFNQLNVLAALTFNEISNYSYDVALHFPAKLRTINTDICLNGSDCFWISRCSGMLHPPGEVTTKLYDIYESEGFLPIQHQLFLQLIKSNDPTKLEKVPSMVFKSYEYDTDMDICYQKKNFKYIWILYNFLYFIIFLNLIWRISREIEEDIPRYYSLHGFSINQYWRQHFVVGFMHLLLLNILSIVYLMHEITSNYDEMFFHAIFFMIFLLFFDTILLLYIFILTTLVPYAKTSLMLGVILWFISFAILSSLLINTLTIDGYVVITLLLAPQNFFTYGIIYFEKFNINEFWKILILELIVIVLYVIILKWLQYFLFGHWIRHDLEPFFGKPKDVKKSLIIEGGDINAGLRPTLNWSCFEYGPLEGHQLVLRNVYVYKDSDSKKVLLKNITMTFIKHEISVILGPRDSGKTTLIRVLAGWQRYHGEIYFNDAKEVTVNWREYRKLVNVLMEKNGLLDFFTVEEQLLYTLAIKCPQANSVETRMEFYKWLALLRSHIPNFEELVRNLNFDQQRLLALCCILSGKNSRIILLDEPARGMSGTALTAFWRIVRQEKLDRTVIVTTTDADEADTIADRIGMLKDGCLEAWATSFHLRYHHGNECFMVVFITPEASVLGITNTLNSRIGDVKIHQQFSDHIIYTIPAYKKSLYQHMLIILEKEFAALGIRNIYINAQDLNDVYSKLILEGTKKPPTYIVNQPFMFLAAKKRNNVSRCSLIFGLFYKKLLYQAPNFLPAVIVFLAIILIPLLLAIFQHFSPSPSVQLGLNDVLLKDFSKYQNQKNIDITRVTDMNLKSEHYNWLIQTLDSSEDFKKNVLNDSYIFHKFGGVSKSKEQMEIWVNEKILHSPAMSLNLAHNLIYRDLYPDNNKMSIKIKNEPIWMPTEEETTLKHINHIQLPIIVGILMPLTMSSFIVPLIEERNNYVDMLQRIAGAQTAYFWMTHFVWDYTVFWILTIIYLVLTYLSALNVFLFTSELVILLMLVFYGMASLFFVYCVFLVIDNQKFNGFLSVFLLQSLFGLLPYLVYYEISDEKPFWLYILMISPIFSLLFGVGTVSMENAVRLSCQNLCRDIIGCKEENSCSIVPQCCYNTFLEWSFPGILPSLLYLIFSTLALFCFFMGLLFYRSLKMYSMSRRIQSMYSVCYPYDTIEVINEKVRISNFSVRACKMYAVLVDQLEYEIPKHEDHVRAVSFALPFSKCLGIYGPRGSGKSHLIEQLVGMRPIRFGEVYICKYECKTNTNEAIRNLGYCPSSKGLIEGATPHQMFILFFRLNGFQKDEYFQEIREISMALNLRQYMNTRISELPMNIRRRVNVAIALIYQNKVLIFDEPTKGVSSGERNLIWNIIKKARNQGNAVIIASQDSRELEELADTVIMVHHGDMLSIESPHGIRNLYTVGVYVEIKLYSEGDTLLEVERNFYKDMENILRFVTYLVTNSQLLSRRGHVLKFYIPIASVSYSFLFGALEKNRERLNISEYIIKQGTLATAYDNLYKAKEQQIRYEPGNFEG